MYKQVFPSPLTTDTPDIHCGHNDFAHRIFPRLVHQNGMTALEELEASAHSASAFLSWAFSLTNEMLPLTDESATLHLRDIGVRLESIDNRPLVVITLTKPKETIGTYYIGLLAPLSSDPIPETPLRYFTLERSSPRGTALCEWVGDGIDTFTHRYLTSGPKPSEANFAKALAQYLEFAG